MAMPHAEIRAGYCRAYWVQVWGIIGDDHAEGSGESPTICRRSTIYRGVLRRVVLVKILVAP
jgi:hypothetical protein